MAGGAWTVSTTAAATIRRCVLHFPRYVPVHSFASTIRRLREITEA